MTALLVLLARNDYLHSVIAYTVIYIRKIN